jgi:hypothetical protein
VSQFLDARGIERANRPLLGIEPRNATRESRIARRIGGGERPQPMTRMKRASLEIRRVFSDTRNDQPVGSANVVTTRAPAVAPVPATMSDAVGFAAFEIT